MEKFLGFAMLGVEQQKEVPFAPIWNKDSHSGRADANTLVGRGFAEFELQQDLLYQLVKVKPPAPERKMHWVSMRSWLCTSYLIKRRGEGQSQGTGMFPPPNSNSNLQV